MVTGVRLQRRQPIDRITRSVPSSVPRGSPRINRPRHKRQQERLNHRDTESAEKTAPSLRVLCASVVYIVGATVCVTLRCSELRRTKLPISSGSPDILPCHQVIARATSRNRIDRATFESGKRIAIYGGTGGACIDRALSFVGSTVGRLGDREDSLLSLERV